MAVSLLTIFSTRKVVDKMCCNERTVRKINGKAERKSYKVQTIPIKNTTKNQEIKKKRTKKYSLDFSQKLNSEQWETKYAYLCVVRFFLTTCPGIQVALNDNKFKTKRKSNFQKKILKWQDICGCGTEGSLL